MKVKELIEVLSNLDGDKEVFVAHDILDWSGDVNVSEKDELHFFDADAYSITTANDVVVLF